MLILKSIVKEYTARDTAIKALKDINIEFKENGFISILGPSGCGKTTLLNIIGGLDGYTSGNLSVYGKSTKEFSDRDWDTYRNNSTGFVFQSNNLIPHQTVLANVELALIFSGVSKSECRERAIAVLKKVGLGDQLHQKPNQMSRGQMRRVAIARALVKDPDILLADEPASALDSEASVQIMKILTEIAKDKLIIMVTNNPELAMQYSTRIIKLLDGNVVDDSNPYHVVVEKPFKHKNGKKEKHKKTSLSLFTVLSLGINNLMSEKARIFMASFAGSTCIIGIALIWAFLSGVQPYIRIAVAAISLVVYFIMIGIIRYISVHDRTKEIGILRSIGASRKDISRIFNVESLIVGFVAGVIGISVTLLLSIPVKMITKAATGFSGIAALPFARGIALVFISIALNFLAGLLPSNIAAGKNPVVALGSE